MQKEVTFSIKEFILRSALYAVGVFMVYETLTLGWMSYMNGNRWMLVSISAIIGGLVVLLWIDDNKQIKQSPTYESYIEEENRYLKERLQAIQHYFMATSWKTRDMIYHIANDIEGGDFRVDHLSKDNAMILSAVGSMFSGSIERDIQKLNGFPCAVSANRDRIDLKKYDIDFLENLPAVYLLDFYFRLIYSNDKSKAKEETLQAYNHDKKTPKNAYLPPFGKIAVNKYTGRPFYEISEADPLPENAEWMDVLEAIKQEP